MITQEYFAHFELMRAQIHTVHIIENQLTLGLDWWLCVQWHSCVGIMEIKSDTWPL